MDNKVLPVVETDVVVIGGGPAGSTASTLLAQKGHKVSLFEREHFPRFHIGESLIPCTYFVLERLNMLPKMKGSHFVKKYSVQFITDKGRLSEPFYFVEHKPHESSQTWQVLRSEFDEMMLRNAQEHGVEVEEGVHVTSVLWEGEKAVGVRIKREDGTQQEVRAKVVVDASGQGTMIMDRMNLREWDPLLKKAALWTYWEGAYRDTGRDEGATLVIQVEGKNGWFWYIPQHDNTISVGVVASHEYLFKNRAGKTHEQIYFEEVERCPGLKPRLVGAKRAGPYRAAKEYSYRSKKAAGDGWVLIGDAFGFLDPLYSSGVLLALKSGQMAADAISDGLKKGDTSAAQLGQWEPDFVKGMERMRRLVCAYYDGFSFGRFVKRFPHLKGLVTDLLIGDLFKDEVDQVWPAMEQIWDEVRQPEMVTAQVVRMTASALSQVLLALAAVIFFGRVFAVALKWLGQPPVIGEVLAGIALGPSLFSLFGYDVSPLLPKDVAPYLSIIAQLGVILYMFLVGLEFNPSELKAHAKAAIAISQASIVLPLALGAILAVGLFEQLAPAGTTLASFALFMGVAMAVTAFPVLARILTDRGIAGTKIGVLALSCAAAADVTAWWLLAFVSGVVKSQAGGTIYVVIFSLLYIGAMLTVVRPLAARLIAKSSANGLSATTVAVIFSTLLLSAWTTEAIGIHAVFGAFLLGVVIPHESHIAKSLQAGLEQVVTVLLLPAFFAYTGMRTQIGLVSGWQQWLICGLIILVASVGKFGGTLAAARLAGLDWRTGASLGILMNTRGLMELIVLNVGLDLGVISPTLFAMMVLMALTTTLATSPLLTLLESKVVYSISTSTNC